MLLEGCALELNLPTGLRSRGGAGLRFGAAIGPGQSVLLTTCRANPLRTFDPQRATALKDRNEPPASTRLLGTSQLTDGTPCVLFRRLRVTGGRRIHTVHAYCAVRDFEYRFVLIPNRLPEPHEELMVSTLRQVRFTRVLAPALHEDAFRRRALFAGAAVAIVLLGATAGFWAMRVRNAKSDDTRPDAPSVSEEPERGTTRPSHDAAQAGAPKS